MSPGWARRARHAAAVGWLVVALSWPLLTAAQAVAQPAGSADALLQARVERITQWQGLLVQGVWMRELSALAWDPQRDELVAASDRGFIFRLLQTAAGGDWLPVSALSLASPSGGSKAPNVEALAWRSRVHGQGELWLSGEQDDQAWRVSPDGVLHEGRSLPAALLDVQRAGRHGVEALAWHAERGLLAALQKPQLWLQGHSDRWHAVHASTGHRWLFPPAGPRSDVKAIEWLPGHRLLVLERLTLPPGPTAGVDVPARRWRTILRLLHLHTCGEEVTCQAATVVVEPALAEGSDNFEGLACADDGRCWLVSDSGPREATPTRLVQLRLHMPLGAQRLPR